MSPYALIRYALLALPLSFAALPLYVLLPKHYAAEYGLSLSVLGTLLLVARIGDAIADPLIGRYVDRVIAAQPGKIAWPIILAALFMMLGFAMLWWAPRLSQLAQLFMLACALACCYPAYSFLTVLHQAWGAQLSKQRDELSRLMSYREAAGLIGVLIASAMPSLLGLAALPLALALGLLLALWALSKGPKPAIQSLNHIPILSLRYSFSRIYSNNKFVNLCIVYAFNGIASAIPATLLLFFLQDQLHIKDPAPYLLAYFLAAALSLPLWLRMVKRMGLERTWLLSMFLAVLTFMFASVLLPGDNLWFAAVCVMTGAAAGADLSLPNTLVAQHIYAAGDNGLLEGSYFGVWAFLTKLNLALAAGLALPILQSVGYTPGASALAAHFNPLVLVYCWLPCALKLVAAFLLWRLFISTSRAGVPNTQRSP